jgi:hypothetical protein
MYIATEMAQMRFSHHMDNLLMTYEEGARVIIFSIVSFGIAVEYTLWQQPGSMLPILADKHMIVVWHQAVGDKVKIEFFDYIA